MTIRLTEMSPSTLHAVRNTLKIVSKTMDFSYRIRNRKTKNGRYSTLTINSNR
jgi:hypothetical protein